MQQRLMWIDISKGVGIILVVVGHTSRGILTAGISDDAWLLPIIDAAIYAFHMPLFFILSGVTFGMRPPSSIWPDLSRKLWRLFYTLLIWSYAFLAMRALAGNHANSAGSWGDLLALPLPPVAHFWFLWALLLIMAGFAILRLMLRPFIPERSFWIIALIISAIAHFTISLPKDFTAPLGPALIYSLPFAIGAMIGASPIREAVPHRTTALIGTLVFAWGVWASVTLETTVLGVARGSMLALLLLLPMVSLSAGYGHAYWARFTAFLGMISLSIYVMHTMFSAASRILLLKLGIDDLTAHLVIGSAAGIFGPLAAYLLARSFGLLRAAGLA